MSRNTSPNKASSIGEDSPPSGKVFSSDDITVGTPKQLRKKRTEVRKPQTDTLAALNLDCQVWASDLEPWLHFVKRHNI